MCQSRVSCAAFIFLILWGINAAAQGTFGNHNLNNPYSKYGIGEFINGNSVVLRGMGNATSAFENPYEINSDNPASYSFLQRTTFEIGATAETRSIVGSGLTYRTGISRLSYLNIGIPTSKNSGICLGFKPYTHTYYNMVDTNMNSPIGQVANNYNGDGSLNYAYLGGSIKHKGLSIGVNLGYMFGTIRNTTAVVPIDPMVINRAYTTEYTNFTQLGGLYWKAGLMYERKLDSDYTLRIGGTLSLSQNLVERLNAFQISSYGFGDTTVNDTSYKSGELHGKLKMPLSFSIGAMITRNDKWGLGIDYSYTQWSGYNSSPDNTLNEGIAAAASKIAIGGEYTPDANNIRSYFSRVTYRLGAYYGTDYLKLSNTNIPYYGVTVGGSLPFRRTTSKIHMAFDIGRLGTSTNSLLQETYVRFTLGISFNDKWFIPRKYD